jgi:hypothetical protein
MLEFIKTLKADCCVVVFSLLANTNATSVSLFTVKTTNFKLKIQYTELKLSCGNDPVVKNSIYSNGDLDI